MKNKLSPHQTFWLVYAVLILLLLLVSIALRSSSPPASNIRPTPAPAKPKIVATKTPLPTPQIPSLRQTPVFGKSPGVFYPFTRGTTINNNSPTIMGVISQSDINYLATKFSHETSPVSGESQLFLRFLPGRVINLKLSIDSVPIPDVYGFAQYPTLLCTTTQAECWLENSSLIPPLIFMAKVPTSLNPGKHTLTVEGKEATGNMDFYIDPNYRFPSQILYQIDPQSRIHYYTNYSIIDSDNCSSGYYYDSQALKMPLPIFSNPNLFYTLNFPESKTALSKSDRQVQMSFDNHRFDLFFPQSSIFYTGGRPNPFHELFLPLDHLTFPDGSRANYSTDASAPYHPEGYFEILPIDITGGRYPSSSIIWQMSGSSSCDG